jgi:hypothetical protein
MECMDWDAWYDQMSGADHDVLHVAGRCEVESSSVELSLEPGNEGIVDDPELFVLELRVQRPPVGDDKMTEKEVSWRETAPGIKRVRIQGAAEATLKVRDVH